MDNIDKAMVKGYISSARVEPGDKLESRKILNTNVIFSTIDNDYGGAFLHVGHDHIQVIVEIGGIEVFRQTWETGRKQDG